MILQTNKLTNNETHNKIFQRCVVSPKLRNNRIFLNASKKLKYFIMFFSYMLFLLAFGNSWACDIPAEKFCVDYFTNNNLSGTPVLVVEESVIDHNWQSGSPAATIPVDNFSGHWQGKFVFVAGEYTFHTLADDGVRLKIDGQVIIDGWKNQAPTNYYATLPLTASEHTIEIEYYEATAGARLKLDWAPVPNCDLPAGQFCVTYFNNDAYGNHNPGGLPVLSVNESAIDHSWQSGSPDPSVHNDNFSGRWQGKFMFTADNYIFHALADDGVKLKIDGQVVIDGWKNQAPTDYYATVPLTAGEHNVEVEYYEAYGGARLKLNWEPAVVCDLPVGIFCAAYFDNKGLNGNPLLINHEASIAHNWGLNSPTLGLPVDSFSIRWQGQFDFEPGTYIFNVQFDDGVRIWVDDQLIIDTWINQGGSTANNKRWLAGRHRVKVDYFDSQGSALIYLGWRLAISSTTQIGSNLSDWKDWSAEQPFINLFKTSRAWIPQANGVWDTGEQSKLDLDQDGWVRSLPLANDPTVLYRSVTTPLVDGSDLDSFRPGGEYIVLYDGEGRIDYKLGTSKNIVKSSPGRDVVNVISNNFSGIQITIAVTDPNNIGNYIRNIRVVSSGKVCDDDLLAYCVTDSDPACQRPACRSMESVVGTRLFHPLFLRTLTPYSTLRFMAPMSTNVLSSTVPQIVNWSDRSTLSSARWSNQKGIPGEVAIALSNQTHSDPWLNMPHQASDDYIRQTARLAHDTLELSRKVYVEYANEIWNTAFSAGTWVENQGKAEWPKAPDSDYTKRINWYGKRTAEMCDIWRSEWVGAEDKVICVLGGQAANIWSARAALDCNLWNAAPCQTHGIKALAIAPYFGDYLGSYAAEAEITAWTSDADGGLDRLFTELEFGGQLSKGPIGGALAQVSQRVIQYSDLAGSRGLDLIAYEGGQHLAGVGNVINNQQVTNLFVAANRNPRMGDMYSKLLNNWHAAGAGLFVNYTNVGQYGRYGSWGVLENMTQSSSPKLDALIRYIGGN